MDIVLAVVIFLLTAAMAYLGVHVTLHPEVVETAAGKKKYKRLFAVLTAGSAIFIAIQGYSNRENENELRSQLTEIQRNTKTPPSVTVNVPPAQIVLTPINPAATPSLAPTTTSYRGFKLTLGGLILTGTSPARSTIIEANVTIHNEGTESVAHDWSLQLRTGSNQMLNAHHVPGRKSQNPTTTALPLDQQIGNTPLLADGEAVGPVSFIVPDILPNDLVQKTDIKFILSVKDDKDRRWKTEKTMSELRKEFDNHSQPPTP
jgi:hypothetical protein